MLVPHGFLNECYKACKEQLIEILFKLLWRTEKGTLNKSFYDANIISFQYLTRQHGKENLLASLPQWIKNKTKQTK